MASANSSAYNTWRNIDDDELTVDKVKELLEPVQDDVWVAAACVDRLSDKIDVQQALLQVALTRTTRAVERCQALLSPAPANTQNKSKKILVRHFRAVQSDAQLCALRTILLERLDRLNTYVEICKEGSEDQHVEAEEGLDEWEDDPWATQAEVGAASLNVVGPTVHPPVTLSAFLTAKLLSLACQLSTTQWFGALRILLEKHFTQLSPYRFQILDSIPEHAHPLEYRELLPAINHSTGMEQLLTHESWRNDPDLVESSDVLEAIAACNISISLFKPTNTSTDTTESPGHPVPLSPQELTSWYKSRVDRVLSATGMVDLALVLVQHGASQGIPGLDELGEELSLLSRLVYDAPQSEDVHIVDDWTLDKWCSMDPPSVVRAYLAHSTSTTLPKDITHLVMPYLFVREARAERAGNPDPSLPNRLLYDYILSSPLQMVAAIFEASKPTLPAAQRLIRDDEDVARLALACLYGSDSLTEWSTMSHIFECLPAWNLEGDQDIDKDVIDATIVSLGIFVTPSTSQPRCTAQELFAFFKPLPVASLSQALDILDVHLESGEIFARWNVPAPLRWFLQSNSDASEQRAWANRMTRRAGDTEDQPRTLGYWEWLLEDMLKLAGSGDTGIKGAFGLLSQEDVMHIFFSGLLSTGIFSIAQSMLRSPRTRLTLDPSTVEDLCLSCSREFYDNANSGNYKFGDMKLAYECLDVPTPSERIVKEREFIEATSRISSFNVMSQSGIPISPIEIRLTKDRLSLVSRVLSSNTDAYKHAQVILDLCYKLGFRQDFVAKVKVLAMLADTALQAEDFECAYEVSKRMVDEVMQLRDPTSANAGDPRIAEANEVCWVACFQLGRQLEFDQLDKKLMLLGCAIELCPPDKLHDILTAWQRLEKQDVERREKRHSRYLCGKTSSINNKAGTSASAVTSSLRARLQEFHMPSPPLLSTPDAAALASKTFKSMAANFPFSVGSRGRSRKSDINSKGSRSSSQLRFDADDVSTQATRVISKGLGWLIGTDDDN
ncbi:hypothetical protein AX17_000863 [Amanita inopinata Kibby_2008]|nr:hypothetical protein AX17_000863 [Amanita inopinata Kibby_2008]